MNIWDLSRPLLAVNDSTVMSSYTLKNESPTPLFTFKGHRTEGFGLAWSPCPAAASFLATGDNDGDIYIWRPSVSFVV